MKFKLLQRAAASLPILFALLFGAACNADNDNASSDGNPTETLIVTPERLVLGAESGASAEITLTTTASWNAEISGEGFTLDATSGHGSATLHVSATTASPNSDERTLGQIAFTAPGVEGSQTVTVVQQGAQPEPLPETEVVTLDFARGPEIASPALPATSDTALSGRHEYTIDGRTFVLFADADFRGKFFWNDQSQYSSNIPEPNKALYFSKEGAYIEFPAVDGKVLAEIEYVFSTAAGDLPDFDIQTTGGDSMDHSLDYADDGLSMIFTLLSPTLNTPCRLTILNGKNAQPARLVLTYRVPQL